MYETLHSLRIANPVEFYGLPQSVQLRHLAHVRNALGGRYAPEKEAPISDTIDGQSLMASIHRHRHEPPSQKAIDAARMLLSVPGIPENLRRGAQLTIDASEAQ